MFGIKPKTAEFNAKKNKDEMLISFLIIFLTQVLHTSRLELSTKRKNLL